MRGRKKPTMLKILEGDFIKNPQRRNHNEPVPDVAIPEIPTTLGEYGREEWIKVTKEMQELGVISRIERGALERYCLNWQMCRECEDQVAKDGRFYHTEKGDIREHPASKAARDYSRECFRALVEFGMTPCSRSKLHVKKKDAVDPDEQRMFG